MSRRSPLAAVLASGLLLVGCVPQTRDEWTPPAQTASPATAATTMVSGQNPLCRPAPAKPAVEGGLPDLTFDCLGGGGQASLTGLAQGRPVVINIWAQWCGPCRHEAPVLSAVSRQAVGKVDFWGIDLTDPRPDLAIEFAKQAGWDYPQLADPEGLIKTEAPAPPTTLFVAADGRVVSRHFGVLTTEKQLKELIGKHLGVTLE